MGDLVHIRVHLVSPSVLPPAVPAAAVIAKDGADGIADLFCLEGAPDSAGEVLLQLIEHFQGARAVPRLS